MELLGDVGHLESHFIPFGDSVSVGAIGSEIILHAPDGTPRSRGSCAISFGPFGDGVSVSAR